jgi:DNA-binding transcriptional MocR family regulator
MKIHVSKSDDTPIFRQIVNQIRTAILSGELQEGTFLLSERKLAELIGVHRNTVSRVYHELSSEGYIDTVKGKGHRVCLWEDTKATETVHSAVPWMALMSGALADHKSAYDDIFSKSASGDYSDICFASGLVPKEAYFEKDIRQILRELADTKHSEIFRYSAYQGQKQLRVNICTLLCAMGINAAPGELQIVNEMNQALSYLTTLFTERGDSVIVEEPTSPDIYRTFQLRGVQIHTVPQSEDGLDLDVLETLIQRRRPKLICINSSYQDPTGINMSTEKRQRLLNIAYRNRLPIIEDGSASNIYFTDTKPPSLKSMDENGNVLYIYSFALTFAPGFKMAFILGDRQVIKKLSYLQSMNMINSDSINQSILSKYIESGCYLKNLKAINKLYAYKQQILCHALEGAEALGLTYHRPSGGIHLWCKLPETANRMKFHKYLKEHHVSVMPGALFFPNGNTGGNFIRLNYSYPSKKDIEIGASILTDALNFSLSSS